jgi:hypothetical protein
MNPTAVFPRRAIGVNDLLNEVPRGRFFAARFFGLRRCGRGSHFKSLCVRLPPVEVSTNRGADMFPPNVANSAALLYGG